MNVPHPDDELLSAALDGETDPAAAAHLDGCDACLARRDALDGVRRQVAAEARPAPAAVAERAIAAAVEAWGEERAAAAAAAALTSPGASAPADGTVVPLRRPTVPAAPAAERRRFPAWALGAVAAVAALLLAVPIVLRDSSGSGEQTASAPSREASDEAASPDAGAVDGGHLGALSDPATLREALLRAVPGVAAGAAAGDSAAPAPAAPASSFEAATTAPRAAARVEDGENRLAAQTAPEAGTACRAEVRGEFGDRLGALLYAASLRWNGTEAVVLAYRLADTSAPGPDHLALVMALDGCRVLASQGF